MRIREQITPKGDGNFIYSKYIILFIFQIREQITPKGDGNYQNKTKKKEG